MKNFIFGLLALMAFSICNAQIKVTTSLVPQGKQMADASVMCDTTGYYMQYNYDDYSFRFLSIQCAMPKIAGDRLALRRLNGRIAEMPQGSANTFLKTDASGELQWAPDISVPAGGSLSYNAATRVLSSTSASVVFLSNVTVGRTATVVIAAGVQKLTITGVTGLLAGDRVLLTPVGSTPTGYALADAVATSAGTLEVSYTGPALAVGASFSIPCKLTVFR